MAKIKTSSAKAKGRRLQAEIAQMISKVTCIPVEKDGEIDVRPMGQSGRDVILRGRAKELFCFHGIECKNCERIQIWDAIKQAETHGGKPAIFFKRNRSDIYVVLKAEDFFELYKKVIEREVK
jgi:hypothetical protein